VWSEARGRKKRSRGRNFLSKPRREKPKPEPEPSLRFPIQPNIAHYFLPSLLVSSLTPPGASLTTRDLYSTQPSTSGSPQQSTASATRISPRLLRQKDNSSSLCTLPRLLLSSPIFSFSSSVTLLAVARTHPSQPSCPLSRRVRSVSCCRSSCPPGIDTLNMPLCGSNKVANTTSCSVICFDFSSVFGFVPQILQLGFAGLDRQDEFL